MGRKVDKWSIVNYKLAGSGGFSPHIDSTAYTHVKNIKHLTILLAVDASKMTNGGLEVVEGSHLMDITIDRADNCIEKRWAESQTWVPVELEAGTVPYSLPSPRVLTIR
jgi:2-aminoethylphosphonate dioxygenase